MERMIKIEKTMKEIIAKAQQRQATQANKHRREREFEKDDWVFLATGNLSLMTQTKKLAPRYVGPLRIIEKISSSAYRLEIPATWKIHNVFYVGLLKEYRGETPTEPVQIPPLMHEVEEFEVEEVRNHRSTEKGLEFLVKWRGYTEEENTWQTKEDLANAPKVLANYFMRAGIANEEGSTFRDQGQQKEGKVAEEPPLQSKEKEPETSPMSDQHQYGSRRPEEGEHGDTGDIKSEETSRRSRRVPQKSSQWDDFVRF
jgi:hypothetical protein